MKKDFTEVSDEDFQRVLLANVSAVFSLSREVVKNMMQKTYSLPTYELATVNMEYEILRRQAEKINLELAPPYRDAYFQLVLHPVKACANLQAMYAMTAFNRQYALQKRLIANEYADKVKRLYKNDSLLSLQYNKKIANGKWNHMMDQTHIGYTYWQQPPYNTMPKVYYISPDSANTGPDTSVVIFSRSSAELIPANSPANVFYEMDGYVSIDADHFTKAINTNNISWTVLPDHGRTGSAITPFPVTAPAQTPGNNSPHLEYEVYLYDSGAIKLQAYFSPTLNFHNTPEALQYGISIDDEQPQIISINKEDRNVRTWENWVANNIIIKTSSHTVAKGKHLVKFWMVSPAVVLQKIVIDCGGLKPSYLGPPETKLK